MWKVVMCNANQKWLDHLKDSQVALSKIEMPNFGTFFFVPSGKQHDPKWKIDDGKQRIKMQLDGGD